MQKARSSRGILSRTLILWCLMLLIGSFAVSANPLAILSPAKPVGHFTTSLVTNPLHVAKGGILFMRGSDLYISKDGGQMWDVVTFDNTSSPALTLTTYEVSFIATSPDFPNDGTVFVLFGNNPYERRSGISRDTGISWTIVEDTLLSSASQVVFSPNYKNDHTLYAVSPLSKSTDGGLTWVNIHSSSLGIEESVYISPNYANDHEIIVTSTSPTQKFMKSNDDTNWYPADTGLFNTGLSFSDFLFVPDGLANNGHPIMITSTGAGLHLSENDGDSWSLVSNKYISRIKASRNSINGQVEIIGYDPSVYRFIHSLDSGVTWKHYQEIPDLYEVVLSPDYVSNGIMYGSNYSGLWKSINRGATWQLFKARLGKNYYGGVSEIIVSPTYEIDQTLMAYSKIKPGTSDPAPTSWMKSSDGGRTWAEMPLPFTPTNSVAAMRIVMSPQYRLDQTIFISYDKTIYRSSDGGTHWATFGNTTTDPIRALNVSPGYPTDPTFFAITTKSEIIRSNDDAQTWKALLLPDFFGKEIVLSPTYPNDHTLFLNGGYIYLSTNSGDTWTQLGSPSASSGTLAISPDFASDQTLFWGVDGNSSGEFLKSTDSGHNWTELFRVSTFVQSIAVSPHYAQDQTLLICGNDSYPILSEDGGTTFSAMPTGVGFNDVGIGYENGMATFFAARLPAVYRYEWPKLTTIQPIHQIAPSGSTALIHGSINLQNSHHAPATWNATENVAWLTLSANEGTYPSRIDFTIDPSGLTGSNQTQVSLDVYFSAKQKTSITIPVSILMYTHQTWMPAVSK